MDSEWLCDAFRISLEAAVSTSSIADGKEPRLKDPKLRKLLEGIFFTRKFVPTYNLLLLGILVVISALHWSGEMMRWRRRRAAKLRGLIVGAYDSGVDIVKGPIPRPDVEGGLEESSSSRSSTLDGIACPNRKDIDENEETPLLSAQRQSGPGRNSLLALSRSLLMYQPQPVPFFNRILPSNGMSIVVSGLLGLNIFYCFYHINFTIFEIFVLADRLGSVFVANLPLLYFLAAKNQPLKALTGCSYEFLNIFHRRLGEILCLQGLFHAAGMICVWYTLFRPNHFTLIHFLLLSVNLLGLGAFISYETLYFTSLASFRQRWYELFLGIHVVLQVAALAFLCFHHKVSRPYVGVALGIFLVDRLVYRIGLKSTNVRVNASIMEDGDTVNLYTQIIKQPVSASRRSVSRCIKDGWRATDHVFITIPSLGRSHGLQAHPFTIASAAPLEEADQGRLDLLIRAQSGFSKDLLKKVRHYDQLDARIDGPYGSSHARNMLEDSELAICVAGGSGIAVVWPLVRHLLDVSRSTDTEIAPTAALRRQKVVLIWVVHKKSHLSWVNQHDLVKAANNGVEVIISSATEDHGRPDLECVISELVERYGACCGKKVGVVASGPDGMGRLVRNTCARLVWDGVDVDVTIEKFGW